MLRTFAVCLVLGLSLIVAGCDSILGNEQISAQVDDVRILITVAKDADSRQKGLMGKESLGQDEGMLFVYPRQRILKFWMLNTHIPLDVGFFDQDGVLVGVVSMEPDGGKQIHASPAPAICALEMNHGWFERKGIKLGARLNLPYKVVGR